VWQVTLRLNIAHTIISLKLLTWLEGMVLMQLFLKSLTKSFNNAIKRARMSDEERYLSDSVDLVDLEGRQKRIMYGQAPYQINGRHWLDAKSYH